MYDNKIKENLEELNLTTNLNDYYACSNSINGCRWVVFLLDVEARDVYHLYVAKHDGLTGQFKKIKSSHMEVDFPTLQSIIQNSIPHCKSN